MKTFSMRIVVLLAVIILLCLLSPSLRSIPTETATTEIVTAANTFLATLDPKQKEAVLYSFDNEKQRANWSNFPTVVVPRGGISLKEMNSVQRSAAMALLASVLSHRGYEKVEQIMEGDEVNKVTDRGPGGGNGGPPPGGARGNAPPFANRQGPPRFGSGSIFGKDLYYISILGTPSEKNPWMLQFGGTSPRA